VIDGYKLQRVYMKSNVLIFHYSSNSIDEIKKHKLNGLCFFSYHLYTS